MRLSCRGVFTVKPFSGGNRDSDRRSLSLRLFCEVVQYSEVGSTVRQRGLSVPLCLACNSGILIDVHIL